MALWVDRTHGDDGSAHIQEQVVRLARAGEREGIDMWLGVATRYDRLKQPNAPAN